jgi:proline iminopeptidase
MRILYPEIEPNGSHRLAVDARHTLYVEECGDPGGLPLVSLHGGPGSGCRADHRRYFDPRRYRIVLFDQRGAGRSTPVGELTDNTTEALIADLEAIRNLLGIERWVLFGGSWGAALALAYAQTHPQRVLGMVLRGTFLATARELGWFFRDGASRMFPEAWQGFVDPIPRSERDDLVEAYARRILEGDAGSRRAAARAWTAWADRVVTHTLGPQGDAAPPKDLEKMLNEASIQVHYARNGYFLGPDGVEARLDRLPRVPTRILHGRCDLTCTPQASWRLHRVLPHSVLRVLPRSGHLASEPAMVDALVEATDALVGEIRV